MNGQNGQIRAPRLTASIIAHPAAFAMMGVVAATCLLNSSAQAQLFVNPSIDSYTSFFGSRTPWRMIDGSGLTAGPSGILGAADSTHSNTDSAMWYSDPFISPPDTTPIVTFNLGGVYNLLTTRLWQYNQPGGFTVYGAAEIELSVSADNTNFTTLPLIFPARAGGTNGEPAQDFATAATGVKYVRLQIFNTFGGAQATGLSEVRFLVDSSTAPPIITAQPQHQTQPPGGTATFTVTATSPTPLSYQWRKNGTNLANGGNISGATTNTLVVSNVATADQGNYDVVVSNANGPTPSSAVHLLIGGPLITPTVHSFSSQRTSPDRMAIHTVDGSNLSGPGLFSNTHSNDAAGMWLTYGTTIVPNDLHPAITYDLGAYKDLLITRIWNFNQSGALYLGARTVQVSVSVDDVTYTPLATNGLLQASGNVAEPAQDFATATSTVRYVRLTIFSDYNGNNFLTGVFPTSGQDTRKLIGLSEVRFEGNLSSSQLPFITQQPQSSTNIAGQTATFTVSATDYLGNPSAVAYQWRKNGTNLANGGNISGVTAGTLTVSNVTLANTGDYDAVVRDINNNSTIASVRARLQVVAPPTVRITRVPDRLIAPSIVSFSTFFGSRSPTYLVNGSGLTAGPSGTLGAADSTHGNDVDGTMWYSNPFLVPPDTSPIVTFNLGGVFDLLTTRLWQYNQPGGFTVYGASEIELSVSADNTNFTTLPFIFPARAGGTNGEPAQHFATAATGVNYVRLQIVNTFAGAQATGLSEVRFISPNSGVAINLDNGVLGLHYRVEYRNSLNPADPWQLLQDIPVLSNTPLLVNDPTPIQTQRFYRAVLVL